MTFVLLIKIGFTVSGGYSILFNDHKIDLMACDSDSLSLLFETISIFAVVFFFCFNQEKHIFNTEKEEKTFTRFWYCVLEFCWVVSNPNPLFEDSQRRDDDDNNDGDSSPTHCDATTQSIWNKCFFSSFNRYNFTAHIKIWQRNMSSKCYDHLKQMCLYDSKSIKN